MPQFLVNLYKITEARPTTTTTSPVSDGNYKSLARMYILASLSNANVDVNADADADTNVCINAG